MHTFRKGLLAVAAVFPLVCAPMAAASTTPSVSDAEAAQEQCRSGGPHTGFFGTNINMRRTPGGMVIGEANSGDCAYWYEATSGPEVPCWYGPEDVWHLVKNKRTNVVGYVSACYIATP